VLINAMPMFFFDRVEIVKGPSSAAFGLGEPAGIVNYISKTPSGANKTSVSLGIGENDYYLLNFDTQGRSATNNKISYRIVGLFDHGYGPIHNTMEHGDNGMQAALRYDYDQTTSAQLITTYAKTEGQVNADQAFWFVNQTGLNFLHQLGLPLPPHTVGKDVQLTPYGWGNTAETDLFRINLIAEKSLFDGHFNVHNSMVYENAPGESRYQTISNIYNPSPGLYQTGTDRFASETQANAFTESLDMIADYKFGGVKLKTLFGGNYRQTITTNFSWSVPGINPDGTLRVEDIYNPDLTELYTPTGPVTTPSGSVLQPINYTGNSETKSYSYGFYVQEDISFWNDKIDMTAALRKDASESYFKNKFPGGTTTETGWQRPSAAPRFSVTYKPTKWLSAYALYTEHNDPVSFVPKWVRTIQGNPTQETLDKYNNFQTVLPLTPYGKVKEVGIKSTFLNNKVTLSACYFKEQIGGGILNTTTIIANPDGTSTQVVENIPASNDIYGYEVEISGNPTPRLTFIGGYGYTNGTSGISTPEAPVVVHPPTTWTLRGRYDFGDLRGNGAYVTFGGILYGKFWLNQNPYTYYDSDQYSLDAGIGYRWGNGKNIVSLTSTNITDQANVVGFQGNGYVSPPRRTTLLVYTHNF
jgi:iron complex outermembrane receptor protein